MASKNQIQTSLDDNDYRRFKHYQSEQKVKEFDATRNLVKRGLDDYENTAFDHIFWTLGYTSFMLAFVVAFIDFRFNVPLNAYWLAFLTAAVLSLLFHVKWPGLLSTAWKRVRPRSLARQANE